MKSWIIGAVALLAGLVIGGWAPREDLRVAKEELETTKKMLKSKGRGAANLNGITQLIGIEDRSRLDKKAGREATPVKSPDGIPVSNAVPAVVEGIEPKQVPDAGSAEKPAALQQADKRSMKDDIEKAVDLWKTRSDIARTTLINNLALSADEVVKVDVAVKAMNIRVEHGIKKLADSIKTNDYVGEESFMRLGSELTGAIVQGYDDLSRSLPPDWRANAGDGFSLTDLIDPNVAKPLIDVEDKLNTSGFGQRMQDGSRKGHGRSGHSVEMEVNMQ